MTTTAGETVIALHLKYGDRIIEPYTGQPVTVTITRNRFRGIEVHYIPDGTPTPGFDYVFMDGPGTPPIVRA